MFWRRIPSETPTRCSLRIWSVSCSHLPLIIVAKGCTLTIVNVKDKFEISRYGEYLFDDIVIILESDKKYNSLSLKEFGSFIDFHGSVFVMFNGNPSDFVRNFAGYSGVEIDAAGSSVVDYFTSVDEPSNTKHTKFVTTNYARVHSSVSDSWRRFPEWSVLWLARRVTSPTEAWACV